MNKGETISMKRLKSAEIKKVLFGIIATDGSITDGRFDLFTKSKEYAIYVNDLLNQISGVKSKYYLKIDKRKESYWGYRVYTNRHTYFRKLEEIFYSDRKRLSKYICNRLDIQSVAHMWMCDGSLEHNINRNTQRIQNIGILCLLKYDKEELDLFIKRLSKLGIQSRLYHKPCARGFKYFVKIGGLELQKFLSAIYPHILDDFKYKTILYYRTLNRVDTSLSNTEQIVRTYSTPEDIVRHSWEQEITV